MLTKKGDKMMQIEVYETEQEPLYKELIKAAKDKIRSLRRGW